MFHDRLKRGEQFKLMESSVPIGPEETRLHFGFSNLVVPDELTRDIKLFSINELFTLTSYRKDWYVIFSFLYNRFLLKGLIKFIFSIGQTIFHTIM